MNLIEASRMGNLTRVRQLLAAGTNPNITNNSERRLLLLLGRDPNIRYQYGETPLWWACRNGHLAVVKELLASGADPDIKNEHHVTPLSIAAVNEYLEIVRVLLIAGADPDIADEAGETPLQLVQYRLFSGVKKELLNFFPSLRTLSLRSIIKFRIDITSVSKNLL